MLGTDGKDMHYISFYFYYESSLKKQAHLVDKTIFPILIWIKLRVRLPKSFSKAIDGIYHSLFWRCTRWHKIKNGGCCIPAERQNAFSCWPFWHSPCWKWNFVDIVIQVITHKIYPSLYTHYVENECHFARYRPYFFPSLLFIVTRFQMTNNFSMRTK